MTREKKELWKRYEYLSFMMEADDRLGNGFTPYNESAANECRQILTRIANLSGFDSYGELIAWQENNLPVEVQAVIFGWY